MNLFVYKGSLFGNLFVYEGSLFGSSCGLERM